jgi:hypothetical protein
LPTELNGNAEANLKIAKSGSPGSGYVRTLGSTVDLGNHYVFNTLNTADIRIVSAVNRSYFRLFLLTLIQSTGPDFH